MRAYQFVSITISVAAPLLGFDICYGQSSGNGTAVLLAQTPNAQISPAGNSQTVPSTGQNLDEIVVTAQKRTETLVDVPIAITALSGEKLQNAGVTSLADLSVLVPGLHSDSAGAAYQPTIRGVGTSIGGLVASNVATYVDGVYNPDQLQGDFNLIDIDNVQVLKGPQGTLFGRNATGGAIVVTTKGPSFTPELDASASYGSFGTERGSMYASDGIIDNKVAVSLSIGGSHSDGWLTNLVTNTKANPSDYWNARFKVLLLPVDDLKVTLILDADRVDDPTVYDYHVYNGDSDATLFTGGKITSDTRDVYEQGPVAHINKAYGGSTKIEYDFGFAQLTSLSAINYASDIGGINETAGYIPPGALPTAGVYVPVTNAETFERTRTFSQEVDFGHSGDQLDWVTGLYYLDDREVFNPFQVNFYGPFGAGGAFVATPALPIANSVALARSYAAFADVTYNWGDWHFTVGGRDTVDDAAIEYYGYPIPLFGSPAFPSTTSSHRYDSFTPRAVLRYSLNGDSNVYLSWGQGTKAGIYNQTGFDTQMKPLAQERISAIEAGYKLATPDWRVETSAFYYHYTDLQVATYQGDLSFYENAPAAEIYGGDFHVQRKITQELRVDLSGAYTHARYTDFPNAATQFWKPFYGVQNGTENVSGGTMERTPTFEGAVALDYSTALFGGGLDLNANYSYQTKSSQDFSYTYIEPGYGLLGLRAAWTYPSSHLTVSVIGRNVLNKTYPTLIQPNASGVAVLYGEPANVMLQIDYRH